MTLCIYTKRQKEQQKMKQAPPLSKHTTSYQATPPTWGRMMGRLAQEYRLALNWCSWKLSFTL